jgi:predicted phosphodiesterase
MKTLFLGDTHGRSLWKLIMELEKPDKVIFIGDYFDSDDISTVEQIHNFKEIIEYKKSSGKEVVLLIGNHDYQYMDVDDEGSYSGYQPGEKAIQIKQILKENIEHLQMAHIHEDWLCTHAGVSNAFIDKFNIDSSNIEKSLVSLSANCGLDGSGIICKFPRIVFLPHMQPCCFIIGSRVLFIIAKH